MRPTLSMENGVSTGHSATPFDVHCVTTNRSLHPAGGGITMTISCSGKLGAELAALVVVGVHFPWVLVGGCVEWS